MSAEDDIRTTINMLVSAWTNNDMSAFAALFTEDANYVSGAGVRLIGREAIREGLSSDTKAEQGKVIIAGSWINLIKTDVAIVHNTWEMTGEGDQSGVRVQHRAGIFTLVMVSDGQKWQIAALQNTDLRE